MANLLVSVEKGVEIGAEDALKWLTGADKAVHAAPAVVAGLAALMDAVDAPLVDLAAAAANPMNIPMDVATAMALKAVWPELKAFVASLGVKF